MEKQYRDNKICFICCGSDRRYLDECLLYLGRLEVPPGYETEFLTVTDAASPAAGYNEAMEASDARYKVYLRPDTLIVNRLFLADVLRVFAEHPRVGLLGLVGVEYLPKDGVLRHAERCGALYRPDGTENEDAFEPERERVREVEAVDGFLMVTAADLRWRDDLFDRWDFCDVSQSLEFRRAGWQAAVPPQKTPWAIQARGVRPFRQAESERRKLLDAYADVFAEKTELRALFCRSDKIQMAGLGVGLYQLGADVTIAKRRLQIEGYNGEDEDWVETELEEGHYDLAVTYDFCQSAAQACAAGNVPYLAWVYDCPQQATYAPQAALETSWLTTFDRQEAARLSAAGRPHVLYTPLAPDTELFGSAVLTPQEEAHYRAEISFVGNLYDTGHFDRMFADAPDAIREDALRAIAGLDCVWDGERTLFGKVSQETIDYMMRSAPGGRPWYTYGMEARRFCEAMFLARKANETERLRLLQTLAERHPLTLYTGSEAARRLRGVTVRERVDYGEEMPKVFYMSRINLNITSRSIESGLAQRVWDVLACGGFLLTNYQPELEEYFTPGKELEVYHNIEELLEKADYYLSHEEERLRIALAGYQAVRKTGGYRDRLRPVLRALFPDWRETPRG